MSFIIVMWTIVDTIAQFSGVDALSASTCILVLSARTILLVRAVTTIWNRVANSLCINAFARLFACESVSACAVAADLVASVTAIVMSIALLTNRVALVILLVVANKLTNVILAFCDVTVAFVRVVVDAAINMTIAYP